MELARTFQAVDWHTAGEPLRLITSGVPPLAGSTMLERRRALMDEHDRVRRLLMREPRGHRDMYGAVLTPPVSDEAQFGVLFMHNEGCSTMCGHGIIAVTAHAVSQQLVPAVEPWTEVGIDTPAGLVRARAAVTKSEGRVVVHRVTMANVPSFVYARNVSVRVNGRDIQADVAFGGAFYACVDAGRLGLSLQPEEAPAIVEWGMAIKEAVMDQLEVVHPEEPGLEGIYGTILYNPADPQGRTRNVTVFADRQIDRSPTGTGVSARLALMADQEDDGAEAGLIFESLIGTEFTGRVVGAAQVADRPAVMTEVEGTAYVTGFHTFALDARDPLPDGFFI